MKSKNIFLISTTLLATGCTTMADLDQTLYKATSTLGQRDRVTGERTLSLGSRQSQIQQHNAEMDQALAQLTTKGGKLNEAVDGAGYARAQRVTARILGVSHFAAEQPQWKVFLLPGNEFNAFVNGGSYVMIYKGLLDQVQNDDELAAVIGHEIAHNAANHIGESSTYQQVALISGSKSASRNTFQASFTMNQEAEADRIGILYAALAGYDPYAASRVWQRMYQAEGNQVAISSHPLNRTRIEQTQAIAAKVKAYYTPGKINPDAKTLLENNTLWSKQGDLLQAGSGGGLAALAETALNAYTTRESAKSVEKSQQAHAQTVAATGKAIQVVSKAALDANRLQVTFTYQGAQPLSVLAIAAITPNNGRVVSHAAPPIRTGQQFTLTFAGSQQIPLGQLADQVNFTIDDAETQ